MSGETTPLFCSLNAKGRLHWFAAIRRVSGARRAAYGVVCVVRLAVGEGRAIKVESGCVQCRMTTRMIRRVRATVVEPVVGPGHEGSVLRNSRSHPGTQENATVQGVGRIRTGSPAATGVRTIVRIVRGTRGALRVVGSKAIAVTGRRGPKVVAALPEGRTAPGTGEVTAVDLMTGTARVGRPAGATNAVMVGVDRVARALGLATGTTYVKSNAGIVHLGDRARGIDRRRRSVRTATLESSPSCRRTSPARSSTARCGASCGP